MVFLRHTILAGFGLIIFLIFGALSSPPSTVAQSCGGSFTCCKELDIYTGACIGGESGSIPCEAAYRGGGEVYCKYDDPDRYCEEKYGAGVISNNCTWGGSGQDCSCGSCSVGYVCVYGSDPSGSGPATWRCDGSCCNRPDSCPGGGACLEDGYRNERRAGCAEDDEPPPPPPPTIAPTLTPIPPPVPGDPRPTPYVPCDEVRTPEFHSLRPYQASPCNLGFEDIALFCGNDLIIDDPRTVTKRFFLRFIPPPPRWGSSYEYEGEKIGAACFTAADCGIADSGYSAECIEGQCVPSYCRDNGDETESCWFYIERIREIAIDLEGAYLPIMGFTEPSIGSTDRQYRVINSVFQSETLNDAQKVNEYVSWYLNGVIGRAEYDQPDADSEEGQKRIVDYSGPLKRLLSQDTQEVVREDEENAAGVTRHDQIVVCTNLAGQPTECYPQRVGVSERRLSGTPGSLRDYIPFSSTEDRLGKSEIASHAIQPISSSVFVILYSAILEQTPAILYFAHMEEGSDLAELLQSLYAYQGADLEAEPEDTVVSTSDFCDLRGIRSNPGDNLFAGEITATIEYHAMLSCTFVEEGTGLSGDPNNGNLCRYFTGGDCIDEVDPDYECAEIYGKFDCDPGKDCARDCTPVPTGFACDIAYPKALCVIPDDWSCGEVIPIDPPWNCTGGRICCQYYERIRDDIPLPLTQDCNIGLQIALKTTSETPLAEDVWKRLVANPVSVFRRIFPQIEDEPGRPITRIFDMPAATAVIYSGEGVRVAGNPASGRPANQAELYFPHIGGIHEYFLKCIQKTLRPDGFGEGCISGPDPATIIVPGGDCPDVPDSAIPGKWLGSFKANVIDLANRWTATCTGPLYNYADECYNFVVDTSLAQGVNPAFALTIWLNESGASNYCFCGPTCQDFGVRVSSIYQNLVGQLDWFLSLPFSPGYTDCRDAGGWIEGMHAFLSRFRAGGCNPSSPEGTAYYNALRNTTWQWVTGGCVSGSNFSISWPTDSSCP